MGVTHGAHASRAMRLEPLLSSELSLKTGLKPLSTCNGILAAENVDF